MSLMLILWRWLRLLIITIVWAVPISILVVVGYVSFGYVLPRLLQETQILFLNDIYAELLGILMTVGIVDRLHAHRAARHLMTDLLIEVRSQSNDFALHGLERMRAKRWLTGKWGCLRKTNLWGVHWQHANLEKANLSLANLNHALLTNAKLTQANLRYASLHYANLKNCDFSGADLRGANLWDADLENAKFVMTGYLATRFDQHTILPDGTKYQVTLGIRQLDRFTTSTSLKFWGSGKKTSPAYKAQ